MNLIGEKFREMIGDRGNKNDVDENLKFNPLRFVGTSRVLRKSNKSIYDNKRGVNPKQIIEEKDKQELYESLKLNPLWFIATQGSGNDLTRIRM